MSLRLDVTDLEQRLMSMVAVPKNRLPTLREIVRNIGQVLGRNQIAEGLGESPGADDPSMLVSVDGVAIAIVFMPIAIPVETLGTAVGNEIMWPDAGEAFLASKAHVLLTVIDPNSDPRRKFLEARSLAAATAAVSMANKGLGIFWQSADSVVEPGRFVEDAKKLAEDGYLPKVCFSIRFMKGPNFDQDESIICVSTGLSVFLGREIECGPYVMQPGQLGETVLFVSQYMASQGPIFGDGHTFSFGDTEAVDATLKYDRIESGGLDLPIFRLLLQAQENKGVAA